MHDQSLQSSTSLETPAEVPSVTTDGFEQAPLFQEESGQPRLLAFEPASADRLFHPANREDALLLLGGLCISANLPDPNTRLAVADGAPAIVERGLRSSEDQLLRDGLKERFPLLIEIAPKQEVRRPQVIGFDQIVRLVFRSQEEADAFRFRPVDEFDPESVECRVEPACFELDGEPRFSLRYGASDDCVRRGHLVDRLACAVLYVLKLGETRPDCRPAVYDFLSASAHSEGEDPTLAAICQILAEEVAPSNARQLRAIAHAFVCADSLAPSALVDEIARRLAAVEPSEERTRDAESKWVAISRDVVRSKVALDGDLLTDDKSVLLRGALLALVPDSVEAVTAFLKAEKPAGVRVATFATFLVGLKQGVLNTAWSVKGPHAHVIAGVCRLLTESASETSCDFDCAISASILESADSTVRSIAAGSMQLATWVSPKLKPRDPLEDEWLADFKRLGYQVQTPGRTERSWMVELPCGSTVEIRHCAIAGHRFPMFRHSFDRGEKLRKPKEIAATFAMGGHLWTPRADEDGVLSLCCELPSLPALADVGRIVAALEAAVPLCVAPPKAARKRSVKSTKAAV